MSHRPVAGRLREARHRRPPGRLLALRGLAALDLGLLRLLRTRGHSPRRRAGRASALARSGEHGLLWHAIARRRSCARPRAGREAYLRAVEIVLATLVANTVVKQAVRRRGRCSRRSCPRSRRCSPAAPIPSAHASTSFAGARALAAAGLPRAPLYAVAGAMALSRPYLGVHYPSDIAGGGALGDARGTLRCTAMKIGIVGLPNAGKSSLFNALTRAGAQAANYPFTTVEPNVAVVRRARRAARPGGGDVGATPVVHETIQFHDIAGLVRGAHEGEGLGNKFLGEHPRDRRDPARGARPRRRAGGAPRGPRGPARRRRDDRDGAAVRRPRAGRAPARAGGEAGEVGRQGGGGRGALAATRSWTRCGRGAPCAPCPRPRTRPGRRRTALRRSPRSRCSTWRTSPRASRSSRRRSWWSTPRSAVPAPPR